MENIEKLGFVSLVEKAQREQLMDQQLVNILLQDHSLPNSLAPSSIAACQLEIFQHRVLQEKLKQLLGPSMLINPKLQTDFANGNSELSSLLPLLNSPSTSSFLPANLAQDSSALALINALSMNESSTPSSQGILSPNLSALNILSGKYGDAMENLSSSGPPACLSLSSLLNGNHVTFPIGTHISTESLSECRAPKRTSRPRPKKPKDMPRRPLSAYNIFFKEERSKILESLPNPSNSAYAKSNSDEDSSVDSDLYKKTDKNTGKRPHGKIGFENLAKIIGRRWQSLPPSYVERYKSLAKQDMKRYKDEMKLYHASKEKKELASEKDLDANSERDEEQNKPR